MSINRLIFNKKEEKWFQLHIKHVILAITNYTLGLEDKASTKHKLNSLYESTMKKIT